MINLAGEENVNKIIIEELKQANIKAFHVGDVWGEVHTNYIGVANSFVFMRCWNYWRVSGNMPLGHAKVIYERFPNLSIRAGGHCGNVSPENVCAGKDIMDLSVPIVKKYLNHQITYEELNESVKNLEDSLEKVVDNYDIDTQAGLYKFVEYIRENGIIG
jgi:hypothetical protein